MDNVIRAAIMYFFLLVIFKVSGRRTLLQMTIFDFILILIISEATQQALLGEDFSLTGSMITIGTLIFIDMTLSLIKLRFPIVDLWLDGSPIILIENGRLLSRRMGYCHITESEVMEVARQQGGVEKISEIKFAILEKNGKLSIVPFK
jgi:uncharacterized membrane protein YcaP (DUF421 family)